MILVQSGEVTIGGEKRFKYGRRFTRARVCPPIGPSSVPPWIFLNNGNSASIIELFQVDKLLLVEINASGACGGYKVVN
jgi:hypothetical protein